MVMSMVSVLLLADVELADVGDAAGEDDALRLSAGAGGCLSLNGFESRGGGVAISVIAASNQ
jgi:hypothetical protein